MVKINQMSKTFRETKDKKMPYKNSEIMEAIKKASIEGDVYSINEFIDSFSRAYVRLCPDKSEIEMLNNAYESIATLAHTADYPDKEDFRKILTNYINPSNYGKTMKTVKNLFDNKGINLIGILTKTCKGDYFDKP